MLFSLFTFLFLYTQNEKKKRYTNMKLNQYAVVIAISKA